MPVLNLLRMGNPKLRQISRALTPEEILSDSTKKLIQDLTETMHANNGVGIAAPQVGELVRLSIIEFGDDSARYPNMGAQGLTVFINPVWKVTNPQPQSFFEGCLSVPDLRGLVPRPSGVEVEYLNEKAEKCTLKAEGFLATVIQHEFDHLNGVLYVDRVADRTTLCYIEEYKQFWAPKMGQTQEV